MDECSFQPGPMVWSAKQIMAGSLVSFMIRRGQLSCSITTIMYYVTKTSTLVLNQYQIYENVMVLTCYGTVGNEGTMYSEGTRDMV